jgi:chemotaxis protein histidine kinase CheA
VTATSIEKVNGHTVASHAEPGFDPRALAEAEAIRTRAEAEAEAARIKAQGEAEAEKIKAAEEAERQRLENEKQALANERNALRFRREKAVEEAKIAEAEAKREETNRARDAARREAEEAEQAEQQQANEVAQADGRWRKYALTFYTVCAIVALPVQVAAFYNPHAIWLMAAPLMLEGGAWVVLKGAAAAVASHRPHWHYRLIAWLLAFLAAGINLWHGLNAFDPATAIGTAFASIAGPGVWDLHEHGRIRKRDGVLTRKERKAQEKAAKAEAARKAAEEKRRAAEKQAADKAAAEARQQLDGARAKQFPKVWEHALKIAAALGETTVTEAVWKRAHRDVEGADPAESAEIIRLRNAAEARVEAARQKRPVRGSSPQVTSQVPGAKKTRVYNPPARRGVRTKGDVKYTAGASRQASIAARNAARKEGQA